LRKAFFATRDCNDVEAAFGEPMCYGLADTGTGAGDEDDGFIGRIFYHMPTLNLKLCDECMQTQMQYLVGRV
jgi:hypothetical protein